MRRSVGIGAKEINLFNRHGIYNEFLEFVKFRLNRRIHSIIITRFGGKDNNWAVVKRRRILATAAPFDIAAASVDESLPINEQIALKGFTAKGKAKEGRISYEDGISAALSAFQEAQTTIENQNVVAQQKTTTPNKSSDSQPFLPANNFNRLNNTFIQIPLNIVLPKP